MRDRHYFGSAVFVGVAVLNHRLGLQLSAAELCILAAVLGLHQVRDLVRTLRPDVSSETKP